MAESDLNSNPGDPSVTDEELAGAANVDAAADDAVDSALAGEDADSQDAVVDAATDAAEVASEENPEAAAEDTAEETAEAGLAAELNERTEDLKRVSAEYANYRRRAERDRAAAGELAKAGLIGDLLPILDDLDMAESHGDLTGPLKAMSDKLVSVLESAKLESFGAEGDEFNPELHEAVQDTSSGDEKVLGTVLRKGYRVGDRVVRNAMVIIADPA